jgi:cytochrome c oxidase subunit II
VRAGVLPGKRPAKLVGIIPARHDPAGRLGRTGRRLALAGIALTAVSCAPTSVTEQGKAIRHDYNVFLYLAAVVFVVVSGLLVWSMLRYRRRNDELPKQTHGNNALELTWTAIPTVLVLILFVVTIQAQNKATKPAARPALSIDVTAFQWSWRFAYEHTPVIIVGGSGNIPEMVLPVGQPVRIKLTTGDVVHSFYVPQALFKRQAIPGITNEFDFTFDKTGLYHGQCTQFCGLAHTDMIFRVKVVTQAEYQRWLATAARTGAPGQSGR